MILGNVEYQNILGANYFHMLELMGHCNPDSTTNASSPENNFLNGLGNKYPRFTDMLVLSNLCVERCFYGFLHDCFLRYLPEHLLHYPGESIVGCNVDKLLSHLLAQVDGNSISKAMYLAIVESKTFLDLVYRHGLALQP